MCYPDGGDAPTITDANLVLGRLPPALIGGGIALDAGRARDGLEALGRELGQDMTVEQLAEGVIEIANWNQANVIRQMTIQNGIDPREFALLSFGGSGPAQSAAVMELLGMRACIVPPNPGNLSAFGLLAVDWRTDHIITKVMAEDAIDPTEVARIFNSLEHDAAEALSRDGIAGDRQRLVRQADIRYAGQSMEVRVDAPGGEIDGGFVKRLADAFHAAHERTYGYAYADTQKIEAVNFCVSGFGLIERPRFPDLASASATDSKPAGSRPVCFAGAFRDTPVFDRTGLSSGASIEGPAVIEEFGSTTVVMPGQGVSVDDRGILVIRPGGETA
jgi:N-methylhydantoinase A